MSRKEEMRHLIEDFSTSGLSIKDYCQSKGIRSAKFFYWRRKLEESQEPTKGFISLDVEPNAGWEGLEIIYPNGVRLKPGKADIKLLHQLVRLY